MFAELALTVALAGWKADIEAQSKTPVHIAVADYNQPSHTYHLADSVPRRELFASYLKSEHFTRQFQQMYGVMIHHKAPGDHAFLILLNGMRQAEWAGHEEAVIAHELGHAWIKALGLPTPVFLDNAWACVSVHAGDIPQHVLIRAELDRRGIDHRTFWLLGLDMAAKQMEANPPPPESDRCARVRVAAQWADVRLGLKEGEWPGRARYEAAVRKQMPEVEETVEEIVNDLQGKKLEDRDVHRAALKFVFERLKDLGYQRTKAYRVYATLKETPHVT